MGGSPRERGTHTEGPWSSVLVGGSLSQPPRGLPRVWADIPGGGGVGRNRTIKEDHLFLKKIKK